MRNALMITALALLPAACAHQSEHVREHDTAPQIVEVERVVEVPAAAPAAKPMARPAASYDRIARWGKRTMTSDQMVTIPSPAGGFKYPALFEFMSEQTGIHIRFDERNASIKSKMVSVVGQARVNKGDLLAWFQDTCAFDNLIAMPYGPADRNEYAVVDVADPNLSRLAQPVHEDDLPGLAGRNGVYVTCALSLPAGLDPSRIRNALSQNATGVAGLGRVMELDKTANVVMVTDFASVVANMRRVLDEMAIQRYEAQ